MSRTWRTAAVVLAAAGGLLAAAPAHAIPATAGSVALTSEPGDYVGAGGTYGYSVAAGDVLHVRSTRDSVEQPVNAVHVDVEAANGDRWTMSFSAPSGQPLAVGTYAGAARFAGAGVPGLSVSGNGRGCNTVAGSFTVTEAVFAAAGYVQTFAVSFEQHCDGDPAALRGDVRIDNGPPPPPLGIAVTVDPRGRVHRTGDVVTVGGQVTCDRAVQVGVETEVSQVVDGQTVFGRSFAAVSCTPGAGTRWEVTVLRETVTVFRRGDATVRATASAYDEVYGTSVTAEALRTVRLRRA